MAKHEPITLLHISDTQFGSKHRHTVGSGGLLEHIIHDLTILKDDFGLKPQAVVLTGDLTETGSKNEFKQVLEFVNGLKEHLSSIDPTITTKRFAIVPGNHDVNRKTYPSRKIWNSWFRSQPPEPYWSKWEFFVEFFDEFYKDIPSGERPIFIKEKPYTSFEMEDIKLIIAGLNSTINESDKQHYGFIGEEQLDHFKTELERKNGWFKIAALHHDISAAEHGLTDSEEFKRCLKEEVNLVLHGHIHNDRMYFLAQNVPVLAIGSAAVEREARPSEVPNQYQIIQILPNRYRRWRRVYYPGQKRWIGDTSIHNRGHDWKSVVPVTFKDVRQAFPQEPSSPFFNVEDFLESGDAITAINLVQGGTLNQEENLYRCLLYKQKYGFFEDKDIPKNPKETIDFQKTNLALVQVKILSQSQEFHLVMEIVAEKFTGLDEGGKSGLLRRQAVAKAIVQGDTNGFDGIDAEDSPRCVTTETLKVIAQYFCGDTRNISAESLAKTLAGNQIKYIRQKSNGKDKNLQICRYKSALQALFSEAAILIEQNNNDTRGWIRLIAGHLLVPRIMITSRAEGYSELLSMIWCEHHQKKDDESRKSL